MNITKLIAFLLSLLLDWERKTNRFLDSFLTPEYALEGLEKLISGPFYFYNPPRQSYIKSDEQVEEDKRKYLEICTLTAENCCDIPVNKIDRAFRQWIEWVISITDSKCERLAEKENDYAKQYPKEVDMKNWRENDFQDFKRDQVKLIARNAALVITQDKHGDWVILHIRSQRLVAPEH